MTFRKIIFWLHLIAGVVAGVVILIMSVTGAALAFEKEIIAWSERDVRRVAPPTPGIGQISLDDLLARARELKPGERPSGITLDADPDVALLVSFGRTNAFYVNPYTGEVREQGAKGVRAFMQTMIAWHRFLGAGEERRPLGKAITGASNVAFLFLGLSGLYLWWPRQWTKSALRAIGVMNLKLRGKARDWNWHNAIGFWTAPVLIVLTATAMPISYQWAGNLIYKITGTEAPTPGAGPGAAPTIEIATPPAGTKPLGMEALFAVARKEFPKWKQISQRAANPGGRGQRGAEGGFRPTTGSTNETPREARSAGAPESERGGGENRERRERGSEGRSTPQAVTLTVIEKGQWPLFASTQLTLDPFTGAVLRKEGFSSFNLGRQVRSWTRFLHTGEALGTAGKLVAGLASAAAALLVWTGFALAWRRFFLRRSQETAGAPQNP